MPIICTCICLQTYNIFAKIFKKLTVIDSGQANLELRGWIFIVTVFYFQCIFFQPHAEIFSTAKNGLKKKFCKYAFSFFLLGKYKTTSQALKLKSSAIIWYITTFFLRFYLFIFFQREGKGRRKRGRETSMCGCLLRDAYWGPGPQPRHML